MILYGIADDIRQTTVLYYIRLTRSGAVLLFMAADRNAKRARLRIVRTESHSETVIWKTPLARPNLFSGSST